MTDLFEVGKMYKMRDGTPVVLVADLRKFPITTNPDCALLFYDVGGSVARFRYDDGTYNEEGTNVCNVLPNLKYPWATKDMKVMVRNTSLFSWDRRYFSHELDGVAYCFAGACTSWSANGITDWVEMRQPTPEELEDAK